MNKNHNRDKIHILIFPLPGEGGLVLCVMPPNARALPSADVVS